MSNEAVVQVVAVEQKPADLILIRFADFMNASPELQKEEKVSAKGNAYLVLTLS